MRRHSASYKQWTKQIIVPVTKTRLNPASMLATQKHRSETSLYWQSNMVVVVWRWGFYAASRPNDLLKLTEQKILISARKFWKRKFTHQFMKTKTLEQPGEMALSSGALEFCSRTIWSVLCCVVRPREMRLNLNKSVEKSGPNILHWLKISLKLISKAWSHLLLKVQQLLALEGV